MRSAIAAVASGLAVAAAVPAAWWLIAHPRPQGLLLASVAGLLLAALPAGYLLRGRRRRVAIVCALLISLVPAVLGSCLAHPGLAPGWRAASIVVNVLTLGLLTIWPQGWLIALPWTWFYSVLPVLIWQAFFEGVTGTARAEKRVPRAERPRP